MDDALEARFAAVADVFVNGHADLLLAAIFVNPIIPDDASIWHAQARHFSYTARHGKGLRRDFGMVVRELEAGFLSGETGVREIPQLLRHAGQFRRSELHVPAVPDGQTAGGLDRRDGGRFQVRFESPPDDYAYQAAARHFGLADAVLLFPAPAGGFGQARSGAVPAAAQFEVRRGFAREISRGFTSGAALRF